jgi:choline dehydrogenase-like flavoprotein
MLPQWEAMGAQGWGYESLKPYFRKAELFTPHPSPRSRYRWIGKLLAFYYKLGLTEADFCLQRTAPRLGGTLADLLPSFERADFGVYQGWCGSSSTKHLLPAAHSPSAQPTDRHRHPLQPRSQR